MLSNICINEDCIKQDLPFQTYYYRTGTGAEIDLIIESAKGILPIEIKFTQNIKLRDLTMHVGIY